MIYIYKYFLRKYIRLIGYTLDMHQPKPHSFCNMALQSGVWDKKSTQELLSERRKLLESHGHDLKQYREAKEELENFTRAKNLDMNLPDKSKNWEMNKIMTFYESFFDEDSGNTREEGIKELHDFLKGEVNLYKNKCAKIMKDIDDIRTEYYKKKDAEENIRAEEYKKSIEENKNPIEENKKPIEENKNPIEENKNPIEENIKTFLPIVPIYYYIYRLFLIVFTFCISFKLINFDLNCLIFFLPDVAIPTIITSIMLFVWECYRFYSKIKKYYKIGKLIYMVYNNINIKNIYKKIKFYYKKILFKK